MIGMSGNEPLDELLLELAEVCGKMAALGNHFLRQTAIGMYHTFVHDSTVGGDCDYAKKAKNVFWEQQKEGTVERLRGLRDQLTDLIDRIENNG